MSDTVAAEATGTEASTGAEGSGEQAQSGPPDIQAELDAVLKKHGGLKYKANGKEKTVDKAEYLLRRLSSADGYDAAAGELQRSKAEVEQQRSRLASLKSQTPEQRWATLSELAGDEDTIFEAAREKFLALARKDKEMAQLSPEARQWREEAEKAKKEAGELKSRQEAQAKAEQQRQHNAQVAALRQHLHGLVGGALQKSGVPVEAAPELVPQLAAWIQDASELGLDVSEDALAAKVVEAQDGSAGKWLGAKAKSPAALVDYLDSIGVGDVYLRERARRLKAQRSGQGLPAASEAQAAGEQSRQQPPGKGVSLSEAFGSRPSKGSRW